MSGDIKGIPANPSSLEDAQHGLKGSDDKGFRGWKIMSFEVLKKLVAEAKGEASRKVIDFIRDHLGGTKLIFVVGQSGTGKSSLLKELTGIDLKGGEGVRSGTLQHHVCPAIIDDDQYIFVDTPGFGAADLKNDDAFDDIVGCLNGLGPFVDVAGLLFVYGGDQARLCTEDLRTIQWVQCFCGPQFYRNIVFVTTKWDVPRTGPFKKMWNRIEELCREPELVALLNPPGRYIGATTYRHGLPGGVGTIESCEQNEVLEIDEHMEQRSAELKALINRTFKYSPIVKLQFAQEMGPKGDWSNTEAAKVLKSSPQSITIEIQGNRAVVRSKRPVDGATFLPPKAATVPEMPTPPGNGATQGTMPRGSSAGGKEDSQGKQKEDSQRKQKTWYERLYEWVDAARAAGAFFAEARKANMNKAQKGKGAGGDEGNKSRSWFSIWRNVRDWWSGTS